MKGKLATYDVTCFYCNPYWASFQRHLEKRHLLLSGEDKNDEKSHSATEAVLQTQSSEVCQSMPHLYAQRDDFRKNSF